MDQGLNRKPNGWALLPFLIFIVIYLGAGLFLQRQGVKMAFYQFPSVTAMFLAVVAAFCMGKEKLDEKFGIFARGAANENVLTMLMIYILAGAFSTVAKSMGGVDATVNLGLAVIPVELLVAGMFVISAFLGTATGTSVGTITALVPIAVGLASESGLSVPMMLGACAGGAMFGDNLSMISDTTIAATKTQGVALKDKFRVNFYIALPAAILTLIILLVIGRGGGAALEPRSFDILKVVPYVLVLALAILGVNVFLTLTLGIFSAGIIGLCAGDLTIFTFAQDIWNGFTDMSEVFFLALFCGGISELIAHNGGIVWLIEKLRKMMHGGKSAQIGMSVLVSLADCATANGFPAGCLLLRLPGHHPLRCAAAGGGVPDHHHLRHRHQPRGDRALHVVLLDPGILRPPLHLRALRRPHLPQGPLELGVRRGRVRRGGQEGPPGEVPRALRRTSDTPAGDASRPLPSFCRQTSAPALPLARARNLC